MAHHKSAKTRIRRNARRQAVNKSRKSFIRTMVKKVHLALESGDIKAAEQAYQNAQPQVHRGVTKGVLHKNTAARMLSRLNARLRKVKTAA